MGSKNRLLVAFAVLIVGGCGGDQSEPAGSAAGESSAPDDPMQAMQSALQQASAYMQQNTQGGGEPISAEALQGRLPETAGGLARTESERQQTGMGGFQFSTANATYEADDGRRITITLTDTGGLGGLGMAAAGWAMLDFDRTTQDGYERTVQFEGFRAMEVLSRSGDSISQADLSIIVADRILVQVEGSGVEMSVIHDVARRLNLPDLARRG